ncbi:YraN family protein [Paenibacillus dendritiformis]|uniref:YraN family protein n=1 Tax=Paenibacillus dendritiformis TaxID=130049 RepID=UPI00143DE270|nr:YraN family protein [Paenibacillus dendritiformis]NKI19670.1 YraN family protein [Paenibacillus dendritiformis]NRF99574.1 YraN family protein [Paenibacillus dendritiformis]
MNEFRRGAGSFMQDKQTGKRRSGGLNRKEKGAVAERLAAEQLQALGYRIIHRNWRCRIGEIDIVARDGNCWVFVEVRSRYGTAGAEEAAEAIDCRKQQKVRAVAEVYVNRYRLHEAEIRFDAVAVALGRAPSFPPDITVFRNAF